jgi:hypothetical protein
MTSTINALSTGSGGIIQTADASGVLALQANGTTAITVNADATTTFASAANLPNTFGFKNRIINGGMVIDQRNAGASTTPTDGSFTLDRWKFRVAQTSKLTVQQNAGSVTLPTGFSNYLGVTSSSAYSVTSTDYFVSIQEVEGFNTADLGWGTASASTVTLSFWVRSSLTGTFSLTLRNSAANRSYPVTYTISSANTWEQKTITVAGDTSGTWIGATNGIGISVIFNLGCGSTYNGTSGSWQAGNYTSVSGATSVVGTNAATWYITGVQLEKGSTATSFDFRSYGTELALCQRYFYKFGGASAYMSGSMVASNFMRAFYAHPVEMRINSGFSITTTITGYGSGANQINIYSAGGFLTNTSFVIAFDFANSKTMSYYVTTMGGGTAGYATSVDFGSSAYILVSAEL